MGAISGSSIANVVTTGAFTIPLMVKAGYKRYFAGAVEAAASTGGQLMPPVMGAAAFVMIEYTGYSYPRIMLAAHLFVFYYGVVADITPPVALAAYAGAGIAKSNQFKTGLYAVGIAMAGFLVPYVFVLAPELLLSVDSGMGQAAWAALPVLLSSLVDVFMVGGAVFPPALPVV